MDSHRPFQVLGIQQIAVGAADKSRLRSFWIDLLGLEYHKTFISETENVDEDICVMGSGDFAVEVDLMQPLDNTVKPRVDLPALNFVTYRTADNEGILRRECISFGKPPTPEDRHSNPL